MGRKRSEGAIWRQLDAFAFERQYKRATNHTSRQVSKVTRKQP